MPNQPASATVLAAPGVHERLAALEVELAKTRIDLEIALAQATNYEKAYNDAEAQSELVTGLYVALQRIYTDLSRDAVLIALQEIIVNLMGCEELVVYWVDPTSGHLRPEHVFGIRAHRVDEIAVGEGALGRAVGGGRVWIRSEEAVGADEDLPEACIPLARAGRVVGAIALRRLLPHKESFDNRDRELMELLQRHATNALLTGT